jgi:hypothetical protein
LANTNAVGCGATGSRRLRASSITFADGNSGTSRVPAAVFVRSAIRPRWFVARTWTRFSANSTSS